MSQIEREKTPLELLQEVKDELNIDIYGTAKVSIRGAARVIKLSPGGLSEVFTQPQRARHPLRVFLNQHNFDTTRFASEGITDIALGLINTYYAYYADSKSPQYRANPVVIQHNRRLNLALVGSSFRQLIREIKEFDNNNAPKTLPEALRAYADEFEAHQETQFLLTLAQEENEHLQEINELTLLFEQNEGAIDMSLLASAVFNPLGIRLGKKDKVAGRNTVIEFLRENNVLQDGGQNQRQNKVFKSGIASNIKPDQEHNKPYQTFIDNGYFFAKFKSRNYKDKETGEMMYDMRAQPFITIKGIKWLFKQKWFVNKIPPENRHKARRLMKEVNALKTNDKIKAKDLKEMIKDD